MSHASSLNLSNLNTSKDTNISDMFRCVNYNLLELDLSNFDASKVTDMHSMFLGVFDKLETLVI
ncbi:MAG: BspA family leucine-rich repeat surface protein [Eggerthellaceae bacterium]|nr:BspA family leucine-rich repeat surface protein [Eggerthellaceae bacterium]